MELRHLKYFVVVAEELHFTRAAQRIGIAQPPLSFQIKALEAELGVQLFERKPGQVLLTEPGKVYMEDARAILEHVRKATLSAQISARGMTGRLRIGFTESASYRGEVTTMLQRYRSLYPDVEISLEESRTGPLLESLRQGGVDVAFVRPPAGDAEIKFVMMSTEPMVVVVSEGHRLATCRSVRLEDLSDELFVLYSRTTRSGLPEMILTECESKGFSPKVVQYAPQISSTINLVASGLGISIVPSCMRRGRSGDVRYISLSNSNMEASLGLAHHVAKLSPVINNLINLVHCELPL